MTKVNEGTTWDIEGVVPAVRVLVLPGFLDPLEDLEERFEFNLSIRQLYVLESALVSLASAFRLSHTINKNQSIDCLGKQNSLPTDKRLGKRTLPT